jgi:hypothetical protein
MATSPVGKRIELRRAECARRRRHQRKSDILRAPLTRNLPASDRWNSERGLPLATQKHFAQTLERVCQERGWELLRSGVRVSWAGGRQQLVELEFFPFKQEELVRLSTAIGSVEQLSEIRLRIALRINIELAHGCLAVKNDQLVMTDTLMLRDADYGEIEASIHYLAETADHYEKTLFGTDQY